MGGLGLGAGELFVVVEELAAFRPSVAWRLAMHAGPGVTALSSLADDTVMAAAATGESVVSAGLGRFFCWPADWIVLGERVTEG